MAPAYIRVCLQIYIVMRYNFFMPAARPSKLTSPGKKSVRAPKPARPGVRELASFRYTLRRFLRFSEAAARDCGITPQQQQLLLGIAGFRQPGRATLSDLAEFLQERHNSVVGLVERAEQRGLVRKRPSKRDGRAVLVSLTPEGRKLLNRLTRLHQQELMRIPLWLTHLYQLSQSSPRNSELP
jgi:DNA-binding MarR family transcriptional regulator